MLSAATPLTGISDGTFMAPTLAPAAYQVAPSGSPWQFSGLAGVSANTSAFTNGNANAPTGTQVAFIKDGASISQQVNFNAGVYDLSFLAAQRAYYQSQNQTIEMLIDGAEVGVAVPASFNNAGTVSYQYSTYQSQTFTVTAGVHTVELLGLSPASADSTAFVTQVAVAPVIDGLVDGGFETPGLAPNGFATDPNATAWQFTGTAGISRNGSPFSTNWVEAQNAPQGWQTGYLQFNGSMSQSVYLDTGNYEITMLAAQRAIYQSSYQEINVYFDGTLEATIDPVNTYFGTYETPVIAASAGIHTITLAGVNPNGGDNTAFVDAVTLAASSALNDASFETPSLGAKASATAPTGTAWQFNGTAGIARNYSAYTLNNPNAPDGAQVGFITDGGSMSQSAYLYPGVYNLSVYAAQCGNAQSQAQSVEVFFNGAEIGLVTPLNTSYNLYQTLNFTVTTAGHYPIEFLGLAPATARSTALIDLAVTTPVNDTLSDGSFETPVLAANASQASSAGLPWQFTGSAGISANGSNITSGNCNITWADGNAPYGNQVAYLQNNGYMTQTVYLDAGGYNISFLAAQRVNSQTAPQQIEVLVDGTVVGTATPGFNTYEPYETMNFQVAAGSHTIKILGLNSQGGNVTALIDHVVLAPAEDGVTNNTAQTLESDAITDGGFESPLQATDCFQIAPDGSPWQFTGDAGVSGNNSGFTAGNPNAPEGVQVAFLKDNATISQQVYLDAGLYNVTFDAAQRLFFQTQPQQIAILVDGTQIGVITPVATYIPATTTTAAVTDPASDYLPYLSANFSVGAGMHTIEFEGLSSTSADSTAFIDSVAVNNADGVNDGSFEQAVLPYGSYAIGPAGTPWQFTGIAGVTTNGSAFQYGTTNIPDGNQAAFLKQTATMSESVYLTTGLYSLSFLAAQRGYSQSSYQTFEVLIDGNVVATVKPSVTTLANNHIPQWGLYQTNPFTVTTGFHNLEFVGLNPNGGDNTALIDDVTF